MGFGIKKIIITVSSVVVLLMTVFCLLFFTDCSNFQSNIIVDREGLHNGDSLPVISLTEGYPGSVAWEYPDELIVGGNHDYSFIYTDASGIKNSGVVTIVATSCTSLDPAEIIKEPTCTEYGIKASICDICGEEMNAESIPMIDCNYETEVTEGDCQHRTEIRYVCTMCGEYKTDENGDVIVEYGDYGECVWETDENGDYVVFEVTQEPTCYSKGKGLVKCIYYDICGSTLEVDLDQAECTFTDEVYVEGDCCHYGYTEYYCIYCGKAMTYADKYPDDAELAAQVNEDGTDTYREYDDFYGEHNYVGGVCTICGAIDPNPDLQYEIGAEESSDVIASLYELEVRDGITYYNMIVTGDGDTISNDVSYIDDMPSMTMSPWLSDTVVYNDKSYTYASLIKNAYVYDGVTSLMDTMFYGCYSLESVQLPEDITEIPDLAFCECRALETIDIPDSVDRIDIGAFYNCQSLSIDISATLSTDISYIGRSAFESTSVYGLDFREFNCSIGYQAFSTTAATYVILGSTYDFNYTSFYGLPIFIEGDYPGDISEQESSVSCNNLYYLGEGNLFEECVVVGDDGSITIPNAVNMSIVIETSTSGAYYYEHFTVNGETIVRASA